MRWKIYYKKNFYGGLATVVLGLLNPLTCLWRGWERFGLKDGLLALFLVLTGLSMLLRSLDREAALADRTEDRDERARWVDLRSRAACGRVGFWLVLGGIAVCLLGYTVTGDRAFVHMAAPLFLLYIAAGAVRLGTILYYENHG